MNMILIDEATVKLVLEALENSVDLVSQEARNAEELYGKYPTRLARVQGLVAFEVAHEKAITALKALAEQPAQQEPVYVQTRHKEEYRFSEWGSLLDPTHRNSKWAEGVEMRLLYTSPPAQRKPLTDDEIENIFNNWPTYHLDYEDFARAIEAAHGIKENA